MTRTRVSGTRLLPLRVGLKVRWRERGAGLRVAVDNGGRQAAAEHGGGIADGELGGRSRRFWIKSNPGLSSAARRSRPPQPPRRAAMAGSVEKPARAVVLRLGALASRARAASDGRTYSATSTSWPTHKAGRRTSDPVLACPKSPPSGSSWRSRSTFGCSPPPPAGAQGRSASLPAAKRHFAWACLQGRRGSCRTGP